MGCARALELASLELVVGKKRHGREEVEVEDPVPARTCD